MTFSTYARALPVAAMVILAGTASVKGAPTEIIELAGADESDVATEKELRESGTNMVPAKPSATSRDPLADNKKATDSTPPPATDAATSGGAAGPAASKKVETKPAPTVEPATKAASVKPAIKAATDPAPIYYLRADAGYFTAMDPDGSGRNGDYTAVDVGDAGLVKIGIGRTLGENLRLDGTFSYRTGMDLDGTDGAGNTVSGEVKSQTALLNLYYDVNQAHQWFGNDIVTPYVGAGVGFARIDSDALKTQGGPTESDAQTVNLAYAAMAGVTTRVAPRIALDIGYRFVNLGPFEQGGEFSNGVNARTTEFDDLMSHEFTAGIRFSF